MEFFRACRRLRRQGGTRGFASGDRFGYTGFAVGALRITGVEEPVYFPAGRGKIAAVFGDGLSRPESCAAEAVCGISDGVVCGICGAAPAVSAVCGRRG